MRIFLDFAALITLLGMLSNKLKVSGLVFAHQRSGILVISTIYNPGCVYSVECTN
jgi:hypothetical protein